MLEANGTCMANATQEDFHEGVSFAGMTNKIYTIVFDSFSTFRKLQSKAIR